MSTMKQCGDLVKVAAVGVHRGMFNPGYEDVKSNLCAQLQVVNKQFNVVIVKLKKEFVVECAASHLVDVFSFKSLCS